MGSPVTVLYPTDGIVLRSEKAEITYMSRFILGEVEMLRRGAAASQSARSTGPRASNWGGAHEFLDLNAERHLLIKRNRMQTGATTAPTVRGAGVCSMKALRPCCGPSAMRNV
jgi:hypothetical protein